MRKLLDSGRAAGRCGSDCCHISIAIVDAGRSRAPQLRAAIATLAMLDEIAAKALLKPMRDQAKISGLLAAKV